MFNKYYENTRHFQCSECKYIFTLTFWQWLFTTMKIDFIRYRYVKCPRCGARHWLKAKKVR
jgi:DNA-directed RNA polymerase subunit RPC12/RpoP